MRLKPEEWISRSVALSHVSNVSVVERPIELLKAKKEKANNNPHKIVAVACSIEHAEQLKDIYESKELNVAIVQVKWKKKS